MVFEDVAQLVRAFAQSVQDRSAYWSDEEIEEALDSRDENPFDHDWVQTDKALGSYRANLLGERQAEIEALADGVRKDVFSAILKKTQSVDLAGYVSDDFELIVLGLFSRFESDFMYSIMQSYIDGNIPCNKMKLIKRNPSNLY